MTFCLGGSLECPVRVACCCPCCRCVFLCAFLRCLSVVSSLCTCVGQVVFGRIKIVSVVVFFKEKCVQPRS